MHRNGYRIGCSSLLIISTYTVLMEHDLIGLQHPFSPQLIALSWYGTCLFPPAGGCQLPHGGLYCTPSTTTLCSSELHRSGCEMPRRFSSLREADYAKARLLAIELHFSPKTCLQLRSFWLRTKNGLVRGLHLYCVKFCMPALHCCSHHVKFILIFCASNLNCRCGKGSACLVQGCALHNASKCAAIWSTSVCRCTPCQSEEYVLK